MGIYRPCTLKLFQESLNSRRGSYLPPQAFQDKVDRFIQSGSEAANASPKSVRFDTCIKLQALKIQMKQKKLRYEWCLWAPLRVLESHRKIWEKHKNYSKPTK